MRRSGQRSLRDRLPAGAANPAELAMGRRIAKMPDSATPGGILTRLASDLNRRPGVEPANKGGFAMSRSENAASAQPDPRTVLRPPAGVS